MLVTNWLVWHRLLWRLYPTEVFVQSHVSGKIDLTLPTAFTGRGATALSIIIAPPAFGASAPGNAKAGNGSKW